MSGCYPKAITVELEGARAQLAAAEADFQQVPLVRKLGDVEVNRRYEQAVYLIAGWQRQIADLSQRLEMAKRTEWEHQKPAD